MHLVGSSCLLTHTRAWQSMLFFLWNGGLWPTYINSTFYYYMHKPAKILQLTTSNITTIKNRNMVKHMTTHRLPNDQLNQLLIVLRPSKNKMMIKMFHLQSTYKQKTILAPINQSRILMLGIVLHCYFHYSHMVICFINDMQKYD